MKRLIALITGIVLIMPSQRASAYRFQRTEAGVPTRWYNATIPYYINTNGLTDFDPAGVRAMVERCMNTWTDLGLGVAFEFMGYTSIKTSENDGRNVIYFVQDPDVWRERFVGNDLAKAVTRQSYVANGGIVAFDIAFNDAGYAFTNSDDHVRTDLANTLTHELGHVLGLAHSEVEDATMDASSPPGETSKRSLADDDIAGIQELYAGLSAGGFSEPADALVFSCDYQPYPPGDRRSKQAWWVMLLSAVLLRLRRARAARRKRA